MNSRSVALDATPAASESPNPFSFFLSVSFLAVYALFTLFSLRFVSRDIAADESSDGGARRFWKVYARKRLSPGREFDQFSPRRHVYGLKLALLLRCTVVRA